MKIALLVLGAVLAVTAVSCNRNSKQAETRGDLNHNSATTGENAQEYSATFRLESLNASVVDFANVEYGQSKPNYSDPDNDVGTPPFHFLKRIDCDVFTVDSTTERLIKKTPDIVSFHSVVILRDARKDLYAFTVTSTVPDKSLVHLRSYGPVTNENPDIVHLPISQRRLVEFPVDFRTGKALSQEQGKCVFIPYPFPADQEYWLFGNNLESGLLQGLYRNDRYNNVGEIIDLMVQAATGSDTAGATDRQHLIR